jgi:predicted  nucleic acid-binding Zn-ribbon protein
MSTSFTPDQLDRDDEDEKATNAQLLADLEQRLQRSEQASEQYRKQLEVMQSRLDEATNEQTASEEKEFAQRTELDKLRAELREAARQNREIETSYESEKRMLLQDRDNQVTKEHELQATVARLNESLRNKGIEWSNASRAGKFI